MDNESKVTNKDNDSKIDISEKDKDNKSDISKDEEIIKLKRQNKALKIAVIAGIIALITTIIVFFVVYKVEDDVPVFYFSDVIEKINSICC